MNSTNNDISGNPGDRPSRRHRRIQRVINHRQRCGMALNERRELYLSMNDLFVTTSLSSRDNSFTAVSEISINDAFADNDNFKRVCDIYYQYIATQAAAVDPVSLGDIVDHIVCNDQIPSGTTTWVRSDYTVLCKFEEGEDSIYIPHVDIKSNCAVKVEHDVDVMQRVLDLPHHLQIEIMQYVPCSKKLLLGSLYPTLKYNNCVDGNGTEHRFLHLNDPDDRMTKWVSSFCCSPSDRTFHTMRTELYSDVSGYNMYLFKHWRFGRKRGCICSTKLFGVGLLHNCILHVLYNMGRFLIPSIWHLDAIGASSN